MERITQIPFLFLLLLFASSLPAQQRFDASIIAGFNLSQLDGDDQIGYDQAGFSGGLRGDIILDIQNRIGIELLFNQKGSQSEPATRRFNKVNRFPRSFDLTLNYIDIPVIYSKFFQYVDKSKSSHSFFRYRLDGGFTFSRLLGWHIKESLPPTNTPEQPLGGGIISFKGIEEDFSTTDVNLTLGFGFYFTKNIGFRARHHLSLIPLFEEQLFDPDAGTTKLRSYHLSFQLFYDLD